MNNQRSLRGGISLALTAVLLLLMYSCTTLYHRFVMKGSIIEASNSDVYLCIGSNDGASVGQELRVYKIIQRQSKTKPFQRVLTGRVKITEIMDEHFAKATIMSGTAGIDDIVELTGQQWGTWSR